MLDQLFEGVESIRLPCSWIFLFAGVALAVYARRRSPAVVGTFVFAAALIAWVRFSGWWFAAPSGALQVVVGLAIIVATVAAWRFNSAPTDAGLGVVVGIVAAWSWLPCVGPELGDILNGAPSEPFGHLLGTIAFVVGLLMPMLLVAAADVAIPQLRKTLDRAWLAGVGAVLLLAFGLLFTAGWSDDLTSQLFSISSF